MSATRLPPTPADVLRTAWRRLRTMRTAIVLLLLLAAAAAVGSFFPQRPIDAGAVGRWKERNPGFAGVAEFFGLFDVYGAWWFMAIYILLLVSLVGCLVPRFRAFARAVRARPYAAANLSGQPHHVERVTDRSADEVLARAERLLRGKRFRVVRDGDTVAADRGNWREGGSLLFHVSFLVLLLGMTVGNLFGFSGQVAVIEGESFVDTPIEYDFLDPGRFFGDGHTGLELALDDFEVTWFPDGTPREFVSRVRLLDDGGTIRDEAIYVNSPMTHDGLRVYQLSWGWAPVVRVEQAGRVLYDGPTVFLSRGNGWQGVIKAPQAEPQQLGLEMLFFADPRIGADGVPRDGGPEPRRPVVVFQEFRGDLNLDVAQSVFQLDRRDLAPGEVGALTLGETAELPNDITVTFSALTQYSVFQLARNPGAFLLLMGAVLVLVGLIPALYSSRRRLWVRAVSGTDATTVEIAGHALQRKQAFAIEFAGIVRELVPGGTVRTGVPSG